MESKSISKTLPLFTVIIPVKNRASYLHHTLRTCMMQKYENMEVIVSDDGSTDNTISVVEKAINSDPRIRYYSHPNGIGMRENFEFVLRQVKPGYVIALGGDDGLLPNAIEKMNRILQDTGKQLLSWPAALYSFPGVYGPNGQMVIYHQKGIKTIKSRTFLERQSRNLYYLTDIESPMFYVKGVASTNLIDRVRERSQEGRFYSCPTPDGYSGIVLAGEVEEYAFSGEPLSIYGMSSSSQGLAYQSDDEQAKRDSELFFSDAALQPMHQELAAQPYSPLISLMTADYLLTAGDLPGWGGKFPQIDYKKMLVKGINELAHGIYGENRICRELQIMRMISRKHGLEKYFLKKVRKSRRNKKISLFDGNGVSQNVFYLDAKAFSVENIYDAAYAVSNIYASYSQLTLNSILKSISRSVAYRFKSVQKGGQFPGAEEWDRDL